ncbi:prepilin peptidase [Embleya sp. NBC_00896]|uniref:prepilin peptidase n=1 Tax=Embleya sp. NBC_00896 TaxID=2975961 RepID=UPI003866BF16|nr:prepilin peptidase [Embleya sp. NBC_00896]
MRRDRLPIAIGVLIAGSAVVWRLGYRAELPAFLAFTLLACGLVACDARLMRLPNSLTLPGYPVLALLLAIPLDGTAYLRALLAMAVTFTAHVLLALTGGGLGLGDAKAAGLVGLTVGWLSWAALLQAILLAYVSAGLYALGRALVERAARERALAFGPFLLGASMLAVVLASP